MAGIRDISTAILDAISKRIKMDVLPCIISSVRLHGGPAA
jgi:hypothetical protein